jgi:thymidylate kinase
VRTAQTAEELGRQVEHRREPVRSLLARALQALDDAAIDWALLREPAAATAGDVDLLVADGDVRRLERVLAPLGFAEVPAWGRGSHRFFVGCDGGGSWVELDVVTELAYGPRFAIPTRAAEACLGRRTRSGGVARLNPNDSFWTLLFHCALDRSGDTGRHGPQLRSLAHMAERGGELPSLLDRYGGEGSAAAAVAAARNGDGRRLHELGRQVLLGYAARHPFSLCRQLVVGSAKARTRRIHALMRRRGPRIALLGPDGAGKSTLAAALESSFFFPVRTFYAGLSKQDPRKRRLMPVPGLRLARLLVRLRWLSLLAGIHQANGGVAVFDRYTYDAWLQPGASAPLRLRRWALLHGCRRADLAVLLDADGETMHQRKDEFTTDELETQRRRFLALADRIPELVIVDARQPEEVVLRTVTAHVWDAHVRRLRRQRGGRSSRPRAES